MVFLIVHLLNISNTDKNKQWYHFFYLLEDLNIFVNLSLLNYIDDVIGERFDGIARLLATFLFYNQ